MNINEKKHSDWYFWTPLPFLETPWFFSKKCCTDQSLPIRQLVTRLWERRLASDRHLGNEKEPVEALHVAVRLVPRPRDAVFLVAAPYTTLPRSRHLVLDLPARWYLIHNDPIFNSQDWIRVSQTTRTIFLLTVKLCAWWATLCCWLIYFSWMTLLFTFF